MFDYILCSDCGKYSITDPGVNQCPWCDSVNLQWADESSPEVTEQRAYELGFIDEPF